MERIRAAARLLQNDEVFYRQVEEKSGLNISEKPLAIQRNALKRRQQELSTLLFKLLEDYAAGLIANANYVTFTNRYQSEQTEIQSKTDVLSTKIEQPIDYHANATQLRGAVFDYMNIDTLTLLILNELINHYLSLMWKRWIVKRC